MKEYKYLFSTIVPVYNVEKYLEEAIKSVVNQTIGFENIHLILINDGSTDSSEEICLKYKNKYPNNIVYDKKENGGASSTRNAGYKYIEGKYVNFLDSDDKYEVETYEKVYNFFENNYNEINLVIIPIKLFELKTGLMYNRPNSLYEIVNILDSEYSMQGSPNHWFFKNSLIKKYYFDEECKFSEDFKFSNLILINEVKYGYVGEVHYLYRIRYSKDSSTGKLTENKTIIKYMREDTLNSIMLHLINISINKFGYVIKYITKVILTYLSWFYIDYMMGFGSYDEFKIKNTPEFIKDLNDILIHIDYVDLVKSDIIYSFKIFLINFKRNLNNKNIIIIDKKYLLDNGISNQDIIKGCCFLKYDKMYIDEYRNMVLECHIISLVDLNIEKVIAEVQVLDKQATLDKEAVLYRTENANIWYGLYFIKHTYKLTIDCEKFEGNVINFWIEVDKVQYYMNSLEIK